MTNKHVTYTPFGDHVLYLETGELARRAHGAVLAILGDTQVLATVVARKNEIPAGFFALTIEYQERFYAAGKIPGGFQKREGRPTEKETLTSRLIDRPIRPSFPDNFGDEVQVVATVLSLDPVVSPDVVAIIAASAALAVSGLPFNDPIAAARIGYKDGTYLLNPSREQLETSALDLVVAGNAEAILMVESEAKRLPEETMLGAVLYGHEMMQNVIGAINELRAKVNPTTWQWTPPVKNQALVSQLQASYNTPVAEAVAIQEKNQRIKRLAELTTAAVAEHQAQITEGTVSTHEIKDIMHDIERDIVRHRIINGAPRIDGRNNTMVRPIHIDTRRLPRAHGSAVFTRGETQALVAVTLGGKRSAQLLDSIHFHEATDPFMLHYNFPPFSVGETGKMMGPKRREIGHGWLARRALTAVLPSQAEFPYVTRVVSEILESNGSSSMATVCGASLALMDAGVPIKAPVAGVAMGLVKDGHNYSVLTDILGDEDHLGDMDFKVAGTADGVTALQMDIKISGITRDIMAQALAQAREGRLYILQIMNEHLATARTDLSAHAPRITQLRVSTDKIGDIIGKGGSTIRALTEEIGVTIDIEDDGTVKIFSANADSSAEAERRILQLTADVEVGSVYEGKVMKIVEFGAFVNILPGKDGLLHISQISNDRVNNVSDHLQEGQTIQVKVIEVDRQGRIKLSQKALLEQNATAEHIDSN